MPEKRIVVAGATGNLGGRIVKALLARKATVVALTRRNTDPAKVEALRKMGVEIAVAELHQVNEVAASCANASCVVSALLGLRDVLVVGQTGLMNAAIKAGVPRFIPSDYSLDYRQLHPGENRNLDLHLEFDGLLSRAPIAATSILNGAFTELLIGPAPLILFKLGRVLYWKNADQVLDFTTMDDVAAFTAEAALDPTTPRYLKVVGQRVTARGLAEIATQAVGKPFKPTWAGTLGTLTAMIKVMRLVMPANDDPFPPWQGMQYTHNMFSGRGVLSPLDNDRYPGIRWMQIAEVLSQRPNRS